MDIKEEEIQKIIEWIEIKEFQKKVLKKRSWFRGLDTNIDPDPHYWDNLIVQINHPLAKQLVDHVKELSNQVVEYDERIDQILELLGYKEKTPDFEGVVKDATKPNDKTYWTKLEEKLAHSARDNNTWRNLEDLINIVVNVKKHLGISDPELDNLTTTVGLAMPTKKVGGVDNNLTLVEMINVYKKLGITNPQEVLGGGETDADKLGDKDFSNMPTGQNLKSLIDIYNSLLPHLTSGRNLNKLIDEANRYWTLNIAANDVICEKGEISQTKINILKNLQQQTQSNLLEEINQLGLGLEDNDITKDKTLQKIKELINKPTCTHTDYDSIKSQKDSLQTELNAKNERFLS